MRKNRPLVQAVLVAGRIFRARPSPGIKIRPLLEGLESRYCPSPTLSLGHLTGKVGVPYSEHIAVTNANSSHAFSYSLIPPPGAPPNNGLPPGLALNATTGLLSGTPTAPGVFDIVVAVVDNTTDATAQEAFPVTIDPLITLTPSLSISSGTEYISLSNATITASGPPDDHYTFTATGAQPPGTNLKILGDSTIQLQGTPTQWGTYSFTLTATDDNQETAVQTYQLTINPSITFNPAPIANLYTTNRSTVTSYFLNDLPSFAIVGEAYSQAITASSENGIASVTASLSGGAPPGGLKITGTSASSLLISGTPTTFTQESAPVQIAVTATDLKGHSDTVYYLLDVEPNPPSPYAAIQAEQTGMGVMGDLPDGVVGQAYPRTTFATSHGSGTFTFSLVAPEYSATGNGGVPPGMTFNADSLTLSGTPTQAGQYSLIIRATSSMLGITDSRVFHLTVNPDPAGLQIHPLTLPLASPGVPYRQQIVVTGSAGTTTSLTYSMLNGTLSDLIALGLGVTQDPSQPDTLTLSGTPTASTPLPRGTTGSNGPLTLSVTATDRSGHSETQQYPIDIYLTPQQIRLAYGLDDITLSGGVIGDGSGQTIVIIDQGDAPNLVSTGDPNFDNSDLHQFDLIFGLPDPPQFTKLDAYGGTNIPTTSVNFAGEETQDVEWVHAMALGAKIILLEGSLGDAYNSIQTARNLPGVTVVSMSFRKFFDNDADNGGVAYIEPNLDALFVSPPNHPMTFLASAGDTANGVSNGEFLVRYPAISSNVVAVGYTDLSLNTQGGYGSESAVFGSGGGASLHELLPPWQQVISGQVSLTMRANPDVTFNGGDQSSNAIYDTEYEATGSPWKFGGGSSIATASWAALIAIADQARTVADESPLDGPTQTLPNLYALAGSENFHPVTTVTDGTVVSPAFGSYNPWAGLGSPVASRLILSFVGNRDIITGTVFNDLDGNSLLMNDDLLLSTVTVYLDDNNSGTLDHGETSTTTDADGNYSFIVPPGSYTVRAVAPSGFVQTSSNPSTLTFLASEVRTQNGIDFGVQDQTPKLTPVPPRTPTPTPSPSPASSPTPTPSPSPASSPTPTPSLSPASSPTPTPRPPQATGLSGVTRSRKGLTSVSVAFDEALNSESVGNLAMYSILGSVKKHRKTVYSKPLLIKTVNYDSAVHTVTINLVKPFKGMVQVTVRSGIVADDGQASDEAFSMLVK